MTDTNRTTTTPFLPDTPEKAFIPDPRLHDAPLSTDAVLCLSSRMRTIVRLLESSGDDGRDGFTLPHGDVLDALWLLESQIEQLRQLAMASSSTAKGAAMNDAAAELRAMAARIESGESVGFLAIEQAADGSASVQAIGIKDTHRLAGLALRLAVGAAA